MHSYPHCVLLKLQETQTIFRFDSFCIPFCDVFFSSELAAHSSPLADLPHRAHPVSSQPFSLLCHAMPCHLKVSSPKPPGWGPCQLLPGELSSGTGVSALFELRGESVPATRSSCQQQPAALSCPLPPVLLQLPEPLSLFSFHLPKHSGPQLFDQVMVPFSQSHQHKNHRWRDQISLPIPFPPTGTSALLIWGHSGHQGCMVAAEGLARHTPPKSRYSHLPFISPSHQTLKKEEQVSSAAKCWSCYCSFNHIMNYKSRSLGLSVRDQETFGCPWCMISCRQATCYGLQSHKLVLGKELSSLLSRTAALSVWKIY